MTKRDPMRQAIVERLLTEHIDGDFLVGCGRSAGNEDGDVAIRDARPSEVAWWAVEAVFEAHAKFVRENLAART